MPTRAEQSTGGLICLLIGDALGNDTGTTTCVAGGIASLRDGITAILDRWQSALRGRDLYAPLLRQLVDLS